MKFPLSRRACISFAVPLLLAPACLGNSGKPVTEDHFFDNFKTVVATADKDGYTPYWLGRGFQAGGLEFRGPFAGDIGFSTGITGGGAQFDYYATLVPGHGAVTLSISLYSPQAWAQSPRNHPAPPGASQGAVTVGIHGGQLVTVRDSIGVARYLEVQLGATVLFAIVNQSIPQTPGPDPNPLADEATFLAVMQNLRPYPQ